MIKVVLNSDDQWHVCKNVKNSNRLKWILKSCIGAQKSKAYIKPSEVTIDCEYLDENSWEPSIALELALSLQEAHSSYSMCQSICVMNIMICMP